MIKNNKCLLFNTNKRIGEDGCEPSCGDTTREDALNEGWHLIKNTGH